MSQPSQPASWSRRRAIYCPTTVTAAVCCGLLLPAVSGAAPTGLRLSYTGDTATSMTVSWNTTVAAASEVRYGTSAGNLTATASGSSFQANAGLGYVHEATLTGLKPATRYYYSAGSVAGGFSAERSFTTGPVEHDQCGRFRFVYLGDNRPDAIFGGGENWPQILGQSVKHQPAFVLNGGDLVIDGDRVDQWLAFLNWTEPVSASLPFMPGLGNHDTGPGQGDTANYNQLFALPRATGAHGSNTEDYYYFTYGNAIFVALSTETFKHGSVPFGEQAAWLDEVLTSHSKKWKFVFYHKPTYTHEAFFDISHPPNQEGQNAAWVAVIDKHHVDVVLTSHNHWYERFEPSACGTQGKPGSKQPCPVGATNYAAGTVYYVSGGAGAFTIPTLLCGWQTGRATCSGDHHYLVFDIDNEVLKIETWSAFPQQNKIIDAITITKSADPCPLPAADGGLPDGASGQDSGSPPAVADATPSLDRSPAADGRPGTTPDAGPDAQAPGPTSSGGCGCQTGGDHANGVPLALCALVLAGLRRKAWALLVPLAALPAVGCSKKSEARPFSCNQLQARAQACELQTLSQLRQRIADPRGGGHSERQFRMFEHRFRERLRDRRIEQQCVRFTGDRAHARNLASMKSCYAHDSCDAFARCMLGL